ncbi:MAG: hypothetical protein VYC82_06060, partial [Verrucomicrobiota bacterium]|nr:hypothetical protein [Verrucomicrobiota bacterium]
NRKNEGDNNDPEKDDEQKAEVLLQIGLKPGNHGLFGKFGTAKLGLVARLSIGKTRPTGP